MGLVTFYVFFVIQLRTRGLHISSPTPNPDRFFMKQVGLDITAFDDSFLQGFGNSLIESIPHASDGSTVACSERLKWAPAIRLPLRCAKRPNRSPARPVSVVVSLLALACRLAERSSALIGNVVAIFASFASQPIVDAPTQFLHLTGRRRSRNVGAAHRDISIFLPPSARISTVLSQRRRRTRRLDVLANFPNPDTDMHRVSSRNTLYSDQLTY